MKEQLTRYVELLFAGAPDATDTKQEILQNTLERYDDLIDQGKTPQAAYQLAISGMGDINEILGNHEPTPTPYPAPQAATAPKKEPKPAWKKALQAIGICLYILCPVPLFILQDVIGLCGLLVIVAIATALMVISGGNEKAEDRAEETQKPKKKENELHKAVNSIIWTVGLCLYFLISFTTQAWFITWVIFPLIGAVQGLVQACMDLKEANEHEA